MRLERGHLNPVTLIKPVSYIPSLVDPITEVSTDKRLPFPVVSMLTDTLVLNEVERDDLPEVSLPWQQHNQVWKGLLILKQMGSWHAYRLSKNNRPVARRQKYAWNV